MKEDIKKVTQINKGWYVRLDKDIIKNLEQRFVKVSYFDDDTIVIKKIK